MQIPKVLSEGKPCLSSSISTIYLSFRNPTQAVCLSTKTYKKQTKKKQSRDNAINRTRYIYDTDVGTVRQEI